jgi:hypothetical protein
MVQQDRLIPGGADYWNQNIAAMDQEKRLIRAQPIPARLAESQKHIDERTRLELYVEHLATKDEFKIPFPNIHGLSPEDQMKEYMAYIEKVALAPQNQQEDAQRSLGGHLKDFGTTIKNGLLSGVSAVLGIPGVQPTMSAISMPGEEITAQLLYNFAKFIPGEQDIERGVKEWKQENPDQPW